MKTSRRLNTGPFPWGMHYSSWCFNCRREIKDNDTVILGTFYDQVGEVAAFVHFDCREVSDRPRVPQPQTTEHETRWGRKLTIVMAAKTKTRKGKKNRKQKAAEENEEETTSATETEEEETTPAPKSKKGKKAAAKAAEPDDEEEDEDDDDDEDEDEAPVKSKKGKKGKTKSSEGESGAVSTGKKLLPLLEGAPKKIRVIATNMSKGKDVTNEDLVTLKEGIKEFAAKDREGDGKLSSQLSALNARVRRMERASR